MGIKHANCGGYFIHWAIPEHHFNFLRCETCGHYLGGDKVAKQVVKLMRIKVTPTLQRIS
jgi:hypothetical protein